MSADAILAATVHAAPDGRILITTRGLGLPAAELLTELTSPTDAPRIVDVGETVLSLSSRRHGSYAVALVGLEYGGREIRALVAMRRDEAAAYEAHGLHLEAFERLAAPRGMDA